ncbi:MAG: hypothetical protein DBX58_08585 [Clostridiales bacterium]|nr:MAG: hypothetical protein DBX58_08585 [Clostridiales bacterium]
MGRKRSPQDEKLVKDLYKKLDWLTFQAAEEEFDADQVKAILKLLDALDPLPERTEADLRKAARARDGKSLGVVGGKGIGEEGRQDISLSDPKAAFERFKKRYGISDEELAKKNGEGGTPGPGKILPFSEMPSEKPVDPEPEGESAAGTASSKAAHGGRGGRPPFRKRLRRFFSSAPGKVAAGFLVVLCGMTCVGIGTSAVQQKPFFEIVRDGVNSMKITVTGNTMESEAPTDEVIYDETERVYYESWDEVKEENPDIMTPGYIPEGLELEELYGKDYGSYILVEGKYRDKNGYNSINIRIKTFLANYREIGVKDPNVWKLVEYDQVSDISYYQEADYYKATWENEKALYAVEGNELECIKEIVSKFE